MTEDSSTTQPDRTAALHAELRASAHIQGCIDSDDVLVILRRSRPELFDSNAPMPNASAVIRELHRTKPNLFRPSAVDMSPEEYVQAKRQRTTTPPRPPAPVDARNLTDAEYQRAKYDLIRYDFAQHADRMGFVGQAEANPATRRMGPDKR